MNLAETIRAYGTSEGVERAWDTRGRRAWYHGTSAENAKKIQKDGMLRSGMKSNWNIDKPRQGAVYITTSKALAKSHAGPSGKVFQVNVPDEQKLVPDEDTVYDALTASHGSYAPQVQAAWMKYMGQHGSFKKAWGDYQENMEGSDDFSGMSSEMKDFTDHLIEKYPTVAKKIIDETGIAAHLGDLKTT